MRRDKAKRYSIQINTRDYAGPDHWQHFYSARTKHTRWGIEREMRYVWRRFPFAGTVWRVWDGKTQKPVV